MPQMKNTLKKITLYTLGTFTGIALSLSAQSFANKEADTLPVQDIRTFAEVYGQIKANYYQETKDDKLVQDAIKGMVSALDPHSDYMDPTDFTDLREQTSGEFGGLGMEIGSEDGFIKVISPIEDTPAERSGVKSGDYIVKINDQSTRGMTTTDAVKIMRGKPGTPITLTLSRKDSSQPIVVKMERAIIKVKSVRSKLVEPDYAYIRVTQFQEPTTELVGKAILNLTKENKAPLKGIILDLRDDPGGLLNGAVGVSAAFLPEDSSVVSTKGRDGKKGMELKANRKDYLMDSRSKDPLVNLPAEAKTAPMTVLINSGSASASEIVAGALQDHKRAVIVGTQSFGKGSVQTLIPLSNGGGVKITTALYYTPNDRSIQAQGIVPDVEVKDKSRLFETREADLAGHLSNPKGGTEVKGKLLIDEKEDTKKDTEVKKEKPLSLEEEIERRRNPTAENDEQFAKALELIKNPSSWKESLSLAEKNSKTKKDDGKEKTAKK